MNAIQFEAEVVNNTIRIPAKYMTALPASVKVTLLPCVNSKMRLDSSKPVGKNHTAWNKFLNGLEACPNDEPIAFERVVFGSEVVL